jgi:hypothetical protein
MTRYDKQFSNLTPPPPPPTLHVIPFTNILYRSEIFLKHFHNIPVLLYFDSGSVFNEK